VSSSVECDDTGSGGEPIEKLDIGRPVPPKIDAVGRTRKPNQVQLAIAEDLLGDAVLP
jgi:hypothetical protein